MNTIEGHRIELNRIDWSNMAKICWDKTGQDKIGQHGVRHDSLS
jgi:hypothetical protein